MMALQPDTVHCVTAHSNHTLDDGSGIKCALLGRRRQRQRRHAHES